jgi:hypothetical protein
MGVKLSIFMPSRVTKQAVKIRRLKAGQGKKRELEWPSQGGAEGELHAGTRRAASESGAVCGCRGSFSKAFLCLAE